MLLLDALLVEYSISAVSIEQNETKVITMITSENNNSDT